MSRRAVILVLDGVGAGPAPDASTYGDADSNTLGHIARAVGGLNLPALARHGLGNIIDLPGMPPSNEAESAWGLMTPASAGKDSTAGHWEIAGIHLEHGFPTYPAGFPPEIVQEFVAATGRGVIGNVVGSGTGVLETYGKEHIDSGSWILYTSADSVFQVAAHESVVPLAELYAACEKARDLLVPPHDVSRVIARPFEGTPGAFSRTFNRRDYSILPPGETLLDALAKGGIDRAGVGKVDDLFAGRSITSRHTNSNANGIDLIRNWLEGSDSGLLFANLVDFDQLYGHRNNV
ncbi:MAG: phosphopentomutase, partial [Gemmatimonadaceae bacterium]